MSSARIHARKSFDAPACGAVCEQNRLGRTRVGITASKNRQRRNAQPRAPRSAAALAVLPPDVGGYDLVLVARGQTPRLKSTQVAKHWKGSCAPPALCRNEFMVKRFLIFLIKGYQKFISPLLGDNCRFFIPPARLMPSKRCGCTARSKAAFGNLAHSALQPLRQAGAGSGSPKGKMAQ